MKWRNNRTRLAGFTLLDSLLALFLFSVLCMLCSGYIKHAQTLLNSLDSSYEKEWHTFLIQLENETKGWMLVEVQPEKLLFFNEQNAQDMRIDFKKEKLIKSENGGYQPLLTRVKQAEFLKKENQVEIRILFENGKKKTAGWIIPRVLSDAIEV